jgi:hypothetical protein
METKPGNVVEDNNKQLTDNSESQTEMLQHEKLIDPGNEHSHHVDDEKKPDENKEARFDADSGDDKTGT